MNLVKHSQQGEWPVQRRGILDWLMLDVQNERFIDNILVELCIRLRSEGVAIGRATLHFRTNHPEWLGARIVWRYGMSQAEIDTFGYDVESTPAFLQSPVNELFIGAPVVRQRLYGHQGEPAKYPIYDDLRAEGMTDYVAWPLVHTLDKKHIISFACDAPGGFSDEDMQVLQDLLPAITLHSEIRIKNVITRTLLRTYVGPHASEQILAGATTRGSGETLGAAILICDLRDFTTISDLWPRDDVIEMLNGYFDAMSEPIERHGGEILKFMGDGLLAVFRLEDPDACGRLLRAIDEARIAMEALNFEHERHGRSILRYGMGVHVGDVMYGNIGSRKRLDFTVIGPAVNVTSRLEELTKETQRSVLFSKAFVEMGGYSDEMESLGVYPLRGVGAPVEVYALRRPL